MSFEEKYEPKHFSELVFADPVTKAICDRYATSKPYKPLMLWGPPGTAKTTTARVIVRERFRLAGCDGLFEEFNGADLTSKDFDKLVRVADYLQLHTDDPILIINELDELDMEEQAKFRAWMDRWKQIRLIVTTNEKPGLRGVKQKLMPALQSRFECVELAPPSLNDWLPRAQAIIRQEGFEVTQAELQQMLSHYQGDVRDMLPMIEEIIEGFRAEASLQPSGSATKPVLHVVSSSPSAPAE